MGLPHLGMVDRWLAIPKRARYSDMQLNTKTTKTFSGYFENRVHSYALLPLVDSIYWTVATMTSTGYGDIKPATQVEMIYACFAMVLGKIMIGYILGITAATLANDESLSVTYKQNVTVSTMLNTAFRPIPLVLVT